MLAEALVIFGCLQEHCSAVMNNYELYNPQFKEEIKNKTRKLKRVAEETTGPFVINYALPVTAYVFRQEATVNLGKNQTLRLRVKDPIEVSYTVNF